MFFRVFPVLLALLAPLAAEAGVRVLTLNAWNNGDRVPEGAAKLSAQILRSGAQLVLLQEADRVAVELAAATGMELVSFRDSTAILSRFPVEDRLKLGKAVGAVVRVSGRRIGFVSVHFTAYPYGPYMACFEGGSNEEVLALENGLRAREAASDLAELSRRFPGLSALVVGGDLNTPSHLDWTDGARGAHCGRSIRFPVTELFERHGLTDAFRELHPDPLAVPGNTWSPVSKHNAAHQRPEPQDRLDMIHYGGALRPLRAELFVDEPELWPSDHAGVLVDFSVTP